MKWFTDKKIYQIPIVLFCWHIFDGHGHGPVAASQ